MRVPLRRLVGVARDTRGAQVAELATVLPLLIMVLLGIMWFGRAFNIYTTLNRAAREAAQTAAIRSCASCGNASPADVQTSVVNPILAASHIDPARLRNFLVTPNVLLNPGSSPPVYGVVVSMEYPYTFTLRGVNCCPPTMVPIDAGVTIRARSQARMED